MVRVGKAGTIRRGFKPGRDLPKRPEHLPPMAPQPVAQNEWTGPVTIACVLRESKEYQVEDVVKLKDGIARNTSRTIRFVCLTDTAQRKFPAGVDAVRLVHSKWETKQSKMELFRPGLLKDWGRTLYMDLDTVICGSIDDLLTYDGEFCMLGDFSDPFQTLYGSGLMAWAPTLPGKMYEAFAKLSGKVRNDVYRVGGGRSDQLFINHYTALRPHRFQDMWPGQVVSYKAHCRYGIRPRDARVICFHGRPKLRDISDEWILKNW